MEAGVIMDVVPDPFELQPAEELDLNVDLDPAELSWHNVAVTIHGDEEDTVVVRRRLLLVDTTTRTAYDAGIGTSLQCGMLQLTPQGYTKIEGAHIDVRRVSKTLPVRNHVYDGPGCVFLPGTAAETADWVQISCYDDKYDYYTVGSVPMQATMVEIEGIKIMQLADPFANLAIVLEIDPTMSRGMAGVLLKRALLGEVRLASRMAPKPDGSYVFSNAPADLVAIKILRHFNNDGPLPPRGTRELGRTLYDREDAIKEIEITGLVGRTVNPDYPPHYRGHPNLMSFTACYADKYNIYMVMEYINKGDLFEAIFEDSLGDAYFYEANAKDCMRQILSGVRFLHDLGVAHLDISSENVFVHELPTGGYRFILADYGQALVHTKHRAADNHTGTARFMMLPPYRVRSAPGKKMYYVPETFLADYPAPFNGFKVDMWQLGVLHIVVFCRSVPFDPSRGGIPQLHAWFTCVQRGQFAYLNVRPPLLPPPEAAVDVGARPGAGAGVVTGQRPPQGQPRSVYFSVGYPAIFAIVSRLLRYFPRDRELVYETHPYYTDND